MTPAPLVYEPSLDSVHTSAFNPPQQVLQTLTQTQLWEEYCKKMEQIQSEAVFHTWILANPITHFSNQTDGPLEVFFSSPSAFHASTLQRTFGGQIKQTLEQIVNKPCLLHFNVDGGDTTEYFSPIKRSMISKKPTTQSESTLFSDTTVATVAQDRTIAKAKSIGLKPDSTFDTFAVSTTNEMAHAAATAVAQRPGSSYNPLFLYGGVGVGKTHLMHAIGHSILQSKPDVRIIYCSGEEFTNEIVQAIQTKRASSFKDKFRNTDVLLIDDIQFIAGKNAVQEEFFHTFNALTNSDKQVVMTSDRPPHEITLLEDRLRSRFEAGLMIDIQQPSFELRTAIVLVKAKAQHVEIPIDIAKNIAAKIDSARKIEGIITIIRSEVELKGQKVTPELIARILAQEKPVHTHLSTSPSDVIKIVANHFHITQLALKGKSRVKHLVVARHLSMYILKQDVHLPLTEIGKWFASRDHTSVIHAIRKIEHDLQLDQQLRQDLLAIRTTLSTTKKAG